LAKCHEELLNKRGGGKLEAKTRKTQTNTRGGTAEITKKQKGGPLNTKKSQKKERKKKNPGVHTKEKRFLTEQTSGWKGWSANKCGEHTEGSLTQSKGKKGDEAEFKTAVQ